VTTKIALVTGANRGLGQATARQLGELSMTMLIGSRDPERGEHAAAALRRDGIDAVALTIDVDSDVSVRDAAIAVSEQYGRLDILVNNAGILPEATAGTAATPVDIDLFTRTFETNVFGAVRMIQHFVPLLLRSPSGRIVNVSTTMGSLSDQADPASRYYGVVAPAYRASKAALNSVTIAVAKSLAGTPVKITSLCPGWIQTDLGGVENRAAAPLTADEAARIVVAMALLADDEPSGQFVSADGTVAW